MGVRQPTVINPSVKLLGWDALPTSLRPGETLPLTLYWQAREQARGGAMHASFTLSALLHSDQGDTDTTLWTGQPINNRYPVEQWSEGEILADRQRWTIPRDQAAGDYRVEIRSEGQSVVIGRISITGVPRQYEAPPVEHVLNVNFGNKVALYGYTMQSNSKLSIEIIWKALDNIPTDYKVFVHLINRDGVILAQRDAMPQSNAYPTSLWLPGEFVVDTYELPAVDSGYALQIGLYSPDDGARLPVFDAQQKVTGDFIQIAY